MFANGPDCALFDFAMTGNAGGLTGLRLEPNAMRASLTIKNAGMLTKVGAPGRPVSRSGQLEGVAQRTGRKVLLRQLSLAIQDQAERVAKVRLGLFESFPLRDGRRNLLHEAGVSALFCRFEYGGKLHRVRLSQDMPVITV